MPGAVFLEGDKINLRTVEKEDLKFLRDNINNPGVRTFLTIRKPQNLSQERNFYENIISNDKDVHLAICQDEDIVGIVSLEEDQDEVSVAEIGIWIDPEHHRNSYGTEAAKLITTYGFNTLNYHRIIARAYGSNTGSQKIWEKLGFTKEGELREQVYREGEFEDTYLYGVLKDEWN